MIDWVPCNRHVWIKKLPEKDLAYAPFKSKLGQDYFGAMACAANYAWTNRHIIGHNVEFIDS